MNIVTVDTSYGRINTSARAAPGAIKVGICSQLAGPRIQMHCMILLVLLIIPEIAVRAGNCQIVMAIGTEPEGLWIDFTISWNSHVFIQPVTISKVVTCGHVGPSPAINMQTCKIVAISAILAGRRPSVARNIETVR